MTIKKIYILGSIYCPNLYDEDFFCKLVKMDSKYIAGGGGYFYTVPIYGIRINLKRKE